MNVNASSGATQNTSEMVGLTMFKKAIDTDARSALALINAIPKLPAAANLPPNLGQNINTTA